MAYAGLMTGDCRDGGSDGETFQTRKPVSEPMWGDRIGQYIKKAITNMFTEVYVDKSIQIKKRMKTIWLILGLFYVLDTAKLKKQNLFSAFLVQWRLVHHIHPLVLLYSCISLHHAHTPMITLLPNTSTCGPEGPRSVHQCVWCVMKWGLKYRQNSRKQPHELWKVDF